MIEKILVDLSFDVKNDKQDDLYPYGFTKKFTQNKKINDPEIEKIELIFQSAFASKRLYYKLIETNGYAYNVMDVYHTYQRSGDTYLHGKFQNGFWTICKSDFFESAYMVYRIDEKNSFSIFGSVPKIIYLSNYWKELIDGLIVSKNKNTSSSACIHCGAGVE